MEKTRIPFKNGKYGLYLNMMIAILHGKVTRDKMKKIIKATSVIALFVLFHIQVSISQQSRNHRITVIVNPVTVLNITGGDIDINITGDNWIVGQDEATVSNTNTTLYWGTNCRARKVTIETSLFPQNYRLIALATGQTTGTPIEAEVTNTASNFLMDIEKSSGQATVRYTAIASASKPSGSDSHVITFTITAQ